MKDSRALVTTALDSTAAITYPAEGAALRHRHGGKDSRNYPGRCSPRALFRHVLTAIVCCVMIGSACSAFGQSTFGSVRGTVQDSTGAAIPETQLVLHSVDENTDRSMSADSSGNFLFENVKAGKYSLKAHHDGFADTITSGIRLQP